MTSLKEYLDQIEGITDKVVSDNCFKHETVDVLNGILEIKTKVTEMNNLLASGLFKGDKGDKGDKGEPGVATLAIDDSKITDVSTWSSNKLNTLTYQNENDIVTDRATALQTKNGFIEILSLRGHSMIIGGEMTNVKNGKGIEITSYNGQREDTKQLLYFDTSENNWKKIKELNGNDECFDSVEYDKDKGMYKYVKRCRLDGNTIVPLEKVEEYRANSLNLHSYEGTTSIKTNTTFFPTMRLHVHTRIQDNVLKNKERIGLLENGLQKISGRGSIINDDEISQRKTWSSKKIDGLINGKPVVPPPTHYDITKQDLAINNTSEGLFKNFLINGKTLTNTITKREIRLQSIGSGVGTAQNGNITPNVKIPSHSQVTLLIDCDKSSDELEVFMGGTYVEGFRIEKGLRTYTTNVNMENGVLTPYMNNTFVSSDNVTINVISLVEGVVPNLTDFPGMKSVAYPDGLYIESIKADGNIFNGFLKSGMINPFTGNETTSQDSVISAFIFVEPGIKYSWSYLDDDFGGEIFEYDERKNYLGFTHRIADKTNATFMGSYIRIQFRTSNTKLLFMLNQGERKVYEPPVFNRVHVKYKENGEWKPVKQLHSVNGVADTIVKHPDHRYYLHEITQKGRSTDLVNPQKKTDIVDRDVWYFDITSSKLGIEVGSSSDQLIVCDKLTPMPVEKITDISSDVTGVIGYAPVVKKVYIALPKGQESDIMAYLKRVNFEFIYPSDEKIYEVNPLYVRSYHPKTNINLRGSAIIPRLEFDNETNLQKIAHENLIRLQQIESELFKENSIPSPLNIMDEFDNRLKRIERSLFYNEYTTQSNEDTIMINESINNIKVSKIYGSESNINDKLEISSIKGDGNLFIDELEVGGINDSTGEPITNTNLLRSPNFIRVNHNNIYSLLWSSSANTPYNEHACVLQYDKDKNYIKKAFYDSKCKSFTPDINCCYIKFRIHKGGHTVYFGKYSTQYKPCKYDKKLILFKDHLGNWNPIKKLDKKDNICDSIELHSDGKYYYHQRVNIQDDESVFEVGNLDLEGYDSETLITIIGISPSLLEVKYYKSLKDIIDSTNSKLQIIEDMVKNNPTTLEEEII